MERYFKLGIVLLLLTIGTTKGVCQAYDWWNYGHPPKDPINVFISYVDNDAARSYNSLKNQAERNDSVEARIKRDWVHLIPQCSTWWCQESTQQTLYNSVNLGTNLYQWLEPLYDNFGGAYDKNKYLMIDSIQKHRGTLAEPGKNGMPMLTASYWYNPKAYHVQSVIYTGNDLSP